MYRDLGKGRGVGVTPGGKHGVVLELAGILPDGRRILLSITPQDAVSIAGMLVSSASGGRDVNRSIAATEALVERLAAT